MKKHVPFLIALGCALAIYLCANSFSIVEGKGSDDLRRRQRIERGESYPVMTPDHQFENWIDKYDTIPGMPGAISHYCYDSEDIGFTKYFSDIDGKPFYYNGRHGYYVILPDEMGYNQEGENIMGSHYNMFFNNDTTLVVSAWATYYDVLLEDYPNYTDSLRIDYLARIDALGPHDVQKIDDNTWITIGRVDHSNPDNPPTDCFISKFVLQKDIMGRECDMTLEIYYDCIWGYRKSEFMNIINQFPNCPEL